MKRAIFICIILLAAGLRLYRLGDVPVGFHRDEAFLGYNAYSILKTGKDMTGNSFPLHLESFLYSPAGYVYASIPAIALFGLNPFAVRLPSATAGILTVIVLYYLAQKLSSKISPEISSLVLALSPWHINLSRTATENTLVVLLLTVATYLFFVYLHKKRFTTFIYSIFVFASTYLMYQAPRAFVPILIPLLLVFGWKRIPKSHRLPIGLITIACVFIPVISIMLSLNLSVRIRTVSVLASQETQLKLDESLRENTIAGVRPWIARMFHNKLTAYAQVVANNYFQHFSYEFLLTDAGLPDRYRVPGSGLMYPLEAIFAIFGSILLALTYPRLAWLVLGWIAFAPFGSALTSDDVPNLQRTLIIFPALSLVTAFGVTHAFSRFRKIYWTLPLLLATYGFVAYLHNYYVLQVYHRPWYRHEGYQQLVESVNSVLPKYSKAIITNHESSPMIFFLFYNRTDPTLIQRVWQQDKAADLNTLPFAQYEFSKESCPVRIDASTSAPRLTGEPNILYVNFSDCKVKDPRVHEISAIRRSDGTEIFRLLEVTP